MRLLTLVVVAVCWSAQPSTAQLVVEVRGVPAAAFGGIDAADFDGDGDNDLMLVGQTLEGDPITGLYTFSERLIIEVPRQSDRIVAVHSGFSFTVRRFVSGHVSWADVDGDGDQDLLMTGTAVEEIDLQTTAEVPATDLFENDAQRTLIIRESAGLPPLEESVAAWSDMDGDGDQDLALAGRDGTGQWSLGVFLHDGAFGFSRVASVGGNFAASDLAWGDYDGDGDQDLLATGISDEGPDNVLLRNETGSTFSEQDPNLPEWLFTSISAADIDSDGDDDLVMSGGVINPDLVGGIGDIFRSDSGVFVPLSVDIEATFAGSLDWGDYDGDGDQDLLVGGVRDVSSIENQRISVYRNDGGTFQRVVALRGVLFGPVIWYDYNGDNRLDILMTGIQTDNLVISIFEM